MVRRYHPLYPSPLPRLWLMSDERMGEALWPALERLPPGSGVIVRHYATPQADRRVLFARVRRIARKRGLMVMLADHPRLARAWGADGAHGRTCGCLSFPVHDVMERVAAKRRGARFIFVSPIFPTRSHPGARTLGRSRFGLLVRDAKLPVIALGGMTAQAARGLRAFGIHGWAAIDGLTGRTR